MPVTVNESWNGATADWNTPVDWLPNGIVPNDTSTDVYDVTLGGSGGYAVSISSGESFSVVSVSLIDSNATLALDGDASLTVDGGFTNGGFLSLDSVPDNGGGSLTIDGTLDNTGSVSIGNSELSAATTVTLGGLTNASDASFEMFGSATLAFSSGGAGFTSNAGKVLLDDILPLSLGGFTNSGTFAIDGSSSLTFGGGFTNDGTMQLNASSGDGGGSLTINGTLDNTGSVYFGNSDPSEATTVTLGGLTNASDASFEMFGSTTLAFSSGGAGFTGNSGNVLLDDILPLSLGAFTNSGTFAIDGSSSLTFGGGFTNNNSLQLNNSSDDGGGSLTFTGALTNASAGSIHIGNSALSSSDGVTVEGGLTDAGAITITSGASHQATLTLSGGTSTIRGSIAGTGVLELTGGSTSFDTGAALTVSNWSISGGTTTLNEVLVYSGVFSEETGSTLTLAAAGGLTLKGSATFSGGEVDGSHALYTAGATKVSGLTIGGTALLENTATLTQSGGDVTIGDTSGAAASLVNVSSGAWDITDDSGIDRGVSASSSINNAGLFEKTSTSGTSTILVSFTDTGTLADAGGDLVFDGPVNSFSGTFIGPGMIDYGQNAVSTLKTVNVIDGSCGTNFGIVQVDGLVTISNGTSITNDAGAHWNFIADVGLALASGSSSPIFINDGTLAKTVGTGSSVVAIDVTSTGTVTAGTGTLAFDGPSDSFAGTISGAGTVAFTGGTTTIGAGAALTVSNWSISGGTTTLNEVLVYSGVFSEGTGSTLTLAAAGGLTLKGATTFSGGEVNGSHALYTEGATKVSGLTIGGTALLENTATLTQSGGDVTIGDTSGAVASLVNVSSGAWDITDDSGIDRGVSASSSINNASLFEKTSTSGTSTILVSFTDTGTLADAGGDLVFDGPVNSFSGTFIGPGMIDYGQNAVSTLKTINVIDGSCGTNFGIVQVNGLVTISNGTSITNDAGAHWNFIADVGLALASGSSSPIFINDGTLAKTVGTGSSVVAIDVTSTGTVTASTGTLAFDGPSDSFAGTISGAGTVAFTGGTTTIGAGTALAVSNWSISGGTTTLNEALVYSGVFSEGAGSTLTLAAAGGLTLKGSATFSGGKVNGSHALYTEGATKVAGLTIGGTSVLENTATLTQSGGNVAIGDTSGDTVYIDNTSTGIYDIADNSAIALGSSTSYFENAGLFEKTGGTAASAITPKITNTGTISATSGTLDLQGVLSGAGTDSVGSGATLEADSTVSAAQTFVYSPSGGEFALDDLTTGGAGNTSTFSATISGFGSGDSLDAGGFGTGTTFVYVPNNPGNTSGKLELTDVVGENTLKANIAFTGAYTTGNFTPHIGASSTLFTYNPA